MHRRGFNIFRLSRRFGTEPDKIDDFKNAERIDNEERDEPPLLTAARRMPERVTFQCDCPKNYDENNRNENAHKFRSERGIKWCESVHVYKLYHTLFRMRYLGVDYGSKRIGLALSDDAGTMGFPHSIAANTPRLAGELCTLIAKENVGAVVIGESRNLKGGENPIAKDARAFGDQIAEHAGIPVFFESEVFTSAEARRMAPLRASVDASAAALILTSYLSRMDKM